MPDKTNINKDAYKLLDHPSKGSLGGTKAYQLETLAIGH
jgi:hypothetical protein